METPTIRPQQPIGRGDLSNAGLGDNPPAPHYLGPPIRVAPDQQPPPGGSYDIITGSSPVDHPPPTPPSPIGPPQAGQGGPTMAAPPVSTATIDGNAGKIENMHQLQDFVNKGTHVPMWVHKDLASDLHAHYAADNTVVAHPGVPMPPRNAIPAVNQGYFSTTGSLAKLGAQSQAAFNSIPAYQHAMRVAHHAAMAGLSAASITGSGGTMGRHGSPTPSPTPGLEPTPIPGNTFPTPTPTPNPTVPPGGWGDVTSINQGEPTVQINPDEGPFNDTPPSDVAPGGGSISTGAPATTTSTTPSGAIIPRDQFGNPVTGRVAVDQYGNQIAGTRAPGTRGGSGGFVGVGPPGGGPTGFGQQPGGGWFDAPMSPGTPGNMFPLYFGSGGQAGRTMSAAALN